MFGKKKEKKKKDDGGYEYINGVGAVPTGDPRWSGPVYPPPSTEDPAFLRNYTGPSGGWLNVPEGYLNDISRPPVPEHILHLENPKSHNLEFDVDALWEKMYKHAKAIFTVCDHCSRVGVLPQSVCEGCGAPLHYKFLE